MGASSNGSTDPSAMSGTQPTATSNIPQFNPAQFNPNSLSTGMQQFQSQLQSQGQGLASLQQLLSSLGSNLGSATQSSSASSATPTAATSAAAAPTTTSSSNATPAAAAPTMQGIGPGLAQLLGQPMTANYQQAVNQAQPGATGAAQAGQTSNLGGLTQPSIGSIPSMGSPFNPASNPLSIPANALAQSFINMPRVPGAVNQTGISPFATINPGAFDSDPYKNGLVTGPQAITNSSSIPQSIVQQALQNVVASQPASSTPAGMDPQIAQNIAITGYAQPFFGGAPASLPTVASNAASNPVGIPPTVPLPSATPASTNSSTPAAPENDSINGASYDGGNPGNWSAGAGG